MRALAASLATASFAALLVASAAVAPAAAKCALMSFLVNDYGKDGPTKDAKNLLDKHIAKTMAARGIKKYTTGKKDVKCELFLDFGVFDEHTCKASATVCWSEGGAPVKPAAAPAEVKAAPADVVTPPKPTAPAKVKAEPAVMPAAPKAKTAAPAAPRSETPAPDATPAPAPAAAPASSPSDGLQAPVPAKLRPKAT
jgi:hypothetical protein